MAEIPRIFASGQVGASISPSPARALDIPTQGAMALGKAVIGYFEADKAMKKAAKELDVLDAMTNLQDERAGYVQKLLEKPDHTTHVQNIRDNLSELRGKYVDSIPDPEIRLRARKAFQNIAETALIQAHGEARKIKLDAYVTLANRVAGDGEDIIMRTPDDLDAERDDQQRRAALTTLRDQGGISGPQYESANAKLDKAWYRRYYSLAKQDPEGYLKLANAGLIMENKLDPDKAGQIRDWADRAATAQANRARAEFERDEKRVASEDRDFQEEAVTLLRNNLANTGDWVAAQQQLNDLLDSGFLTESKEYDRAQSAINAAQSSKGKAGGNPVLASEIGLRIALGERMDTIALSQNADLSPEERKDLVNQYYAKQKGLDVSDTRVYKDGLKLLRTALGEQPSLVQIMDKMSNPAANQMRERAAGEFWMQFTSVYKNENQIRDDERGAQTFAVGLANKIAAEYRAKFPFFPQEDPEKMARKPAAADTVTPKAEEKKTETKPPAGVSPKTGVLQEKRKQAFEEFKKWSGTLHNYIQGNMSKYNRSDSDLAKPPTPPQGTGERK